MLGRKCHRAEPWPHSDWIVHRLVPSRVSISTVFKKQNSREDGVALMKSIMGLRGLSLKPALLQSVGFGDSLPLRLNSIEIHFVWKAGSGWCKHCYCSARHRSTAWKYDLGRWLGFSGIDLTFVNTQGSQGAKHFVLSYQGQELSLNQLAWWDGGVWWCSLFRYEVWALSATFVQNTPFLLVSNFWVVFGNL